MDERRRTEARVHRMQDELIQATKLAVLGQVTAGVAHEINQPLAAMRSFADNAGVLLERGELVRVRGNLRAVTELADRIGLITRELRAFARKGSAGAGPVRVGEALDGALLLLAARLRSTNVRLVVEPFDSGLRVIGERMRLEQVLVNLLQNAIDAATHSAQPVVHVQVRQRGARVEIEVADNGPGLAEDVRAALFTPFVSTKPDGLGLGLVISRDIVAEFDGSLRHADAPTGGAAFIVDLAVA
jgi:two-component system C4-dicarboxylate transport sensor histidine kinase DctB